MAVRYVSMLQYRNSSDKSDQTSGVKHQLQCQPPRSTWSGLTSSPASLYLFIIAFWLLYLSDLVEVQTLIFREDKLENESLTALQ